MGYRVGWHGDDCRRTESWIPTDRIIELTATSIDVLLRIVRYGGGVFVSRRHLDGRDREQVTLVPECLDDFIAEDHPARVIDVFVGELDWNALGFDSLKPEPCCDPWRRLV